MLGIFIGTYDKEESNVVINYFLLAQVSPTKSVILMQVLEETLLEKGIHQSNTRFNCLDGKNPMSG